MGKTLPKTIVKWPRLSKKGGVSASEVRHRPYHISTYAISRAPVKPDAMTQTASARSFHNLGYEELYMAGISFSLLNTDKLELLISEARNSVPLQ